MGSHFSCVDLSFVCVVCCQSTQVRRSCQLAAGGDAGIVFFFFCRVAVWTLIYILLRNTTWAINSLGLRFIVRQGAYEIGLADPVEMKIKLFVRLQAISPLALQRPQYLLLGCFFWSRFFSGFNIHALMPSTYQVLLKCSIDSLRLLLYSCVSLCSVCFR